MNVVKILTMINRQTSAAITAQRAHASSNKKTSGKHTNGGLIFGFCLSLAIGTSSYFKLSSSTFTLSL